MVFLSRERVPHQLMVLVTPVSFFLGHFFLLIKRRILAEVILLLFFGLTLTVNYGALNGSFKASGLFEFDGLLVKETEWDQIVSGKRVLIIGEQPDAYLQLLPRYTIPRLEPVQKTSLSNKFLQ